MEFLSLNRNSLRHRETVWFVILPTCYLLIIMQSDIPNLWPLQTRHLYKMEPGVVCLYLRGQKCVGGVLALINDAFLITLTINTKIQFQYTNSSECFASRTWGLISRYYLFFLCDISWLIYGIDIIKTLDYCHGKPMSFWLRGVVLNRYMYSVGHQDCIQKSSSWSLLLEIYESSPSFPFN